MIDIKVTLQGYDKDSSISEFVGNENNEFNDCRFWINKDIKKPDIWFVFENIIEECIEKNLKKIYSFLNKIC